MIIKALMDTIHELVRIMGSSLTFLDACNQPGVHVTKQPVPGVCDCRLPLGHEQGIVFPAQKSGASVFMWTFSYAEGLIVILCAVSFVASLCLI